MPIEPIGCHYADKAPVGGSFYGNYFQRNQAYEGFVYSVREREIMPKDYNAPDHIRTNHYQREVGRREKITHERFNALGTSHHSEKLKEEPTLTPKQQEEFAKTMKEPLYKFDWTDNFKDPHFIVPGNNKTAYKAQWQYKTPADLIPKPDLSKMKMKPQYYPKNMLEMNLPRVKLYGIDPVHYDNPQHFDMKNFYGAAPAPPKTVTKSALKWTSEEQWNNPFNRSTYKITGKPIAREERSNNLPPL